VAPSAEEQLPDVVLLLLPHGRHGPRLDAMVTKEAVQSGAAPGGGSCSRSRATPDPAA
jgi:hypothetical protein